MKLELGMMDDEDWTTFNGQEIGHDNSADVLRTYTVPSAAVKIGQDNVIAVRLLDRNRGGGMVQGPYGISLLEKKWHLPPSQL